MAVAVVVTAAAWRRRVKRVVGSIDDFGCVPLLNTAGSEHKVEVIGAGVEGTPVAGYRCIAVLMRALKRC